MRRRCDKKIAYLFLAALLGTEAATPAHALTMTAADCARLVEHVAAADAAYTPGVDVYGRPVAPADLPGGAKIDVPEVINFDAAVDLRRFGLPRSSRLYAPNVALGQVSVERSGRVLFNGQPLQHADTTALAEFCRQRLKAR